MADLFCFVSILLSPDSRQFSPFPGSAPSWQSAMREVCNVLLMCY
jgi:hypothetical protein